MGLYKIIKGFDEKALYAIAKTTDNKQLKDDVKYMRLAVHSGKRVYCERIDKIAFFCGYCNRDHFRIVGIGVNKDFQGKGFGSFMYMRCIQYAKSKGFKKLKTRTLSGVDFYLRKGWKITGMKNNDFMMERDI